MPPIRPGDLVSSFTRRVLSDNRKGGKRRRKKDILCQVHPERGLTDPAHPAPDRLPPELPHRGESMAPGEPKVLLRAGRALEHIDGLPLPVFSDRCSQGLDLELVVGARAGERPPDRAQGEVEDAGVLWGGGEEGFAGLVGPAKGGGGGLRRGPDVGVFVCCGRRCQVFSFVFVFFFCSSVSPALAPSAGR